MVEFDEIKNYALAQDTVSVAVIQHHFDITYRQARSAVAKLVELEVLCAKDELNFTACVKKEQPREQIENQSQTESQRPTGRPCNEDREVYYREVRAKLDDAIKRLETVSVDGSSSARSKSRRQSNAKNCGCSKETIAEFNTLPNQSQKILKDTVKMHFELQRFNVYLKMREVGDKLPIGSKAIREYDCALGFLLKMSNAEYNKFKKYIAKLN